MESSYNHSTESEKPIFHYPYPERSVGVEKPSPNILDIESAHRLSVENLMLEGKLPAQYDLSSSTNEMKEKLEQLKPVYDIFNKKGWEPELVFTPKGLTLEQWSDILTGYELPNGEKFRGIYKPSLKLAEFKFNCLGNRVDDDLWDVAVVSSLDKPAILDINPEGNLGKGSLKDIDELVPLLNDWRKDVDRLMIKRISPTVETYLAMRLAGLERGDKTIDSRTHTLVQEDVDGSSDRTVLCIGPHDDRSIKFGFVAPTQHTPNVGIRPTVRAKDLL